MSSTASKSTSFNPNAPAYIPGGLIHNRGHGHVGVPYRARNSLPTAKVPSYVKRLGAGVRDCKPGLLPTPMMPPMRANIAAAMGYGTPMGGSTMYNRSLSISPDGDAYATPYALSKPSRKTAVSTRDCDTSEGSELSPPGFETYAGFGGARTPPGFERSSERDALSTDLVDSLLSLLSHQLEGPSNGSGVGGLLLNESGATPLVSSVSPSESSLGMKQYSDAPAVGGNQPPTNSDDNLLDAIAGYYLPFDMN